MATLSDINLSEIPDQALAAEIRALIEEGRMPGRFLVALLTNDLRAAVDADHGGRLAEWVQFIETTLPIACWGSAAILRAWCANHPHRPLALRAAA